MLREGSAAPKGNIRLGDITSIERGRSTSTAEHTEEESAEHHKAPQQHNVERQEKVGEKDKGGKASHILEAGKNANSSAR